MGLSKPLKWLGAISATSNGAADAFAARAIPVRSLQPSNCPTVLENDWPTVAAIDTTHATAIAPLRPNQ